MFDITKPFVFISFSGKEYPARVLGKVEGRKYPIIIAYHDGEQECAACYFDDTGAEAGGNIRLKNLPVVEETWQNIYPVRCTTGSEYKTEELALSQRDKSEAGFRVYTRKEDGVVVKREIVDSWE